MTRIGLGIEGARDAGQLARVGRRGSKRFVLGLATLYPCIEGEAGRAGFGAADLPHYPDDKALGTAVRFDSVKQQLQVVYLSPTQLLRRRGAADLLGREFQVDQPE